MPAALWDGNVTSNCDEFKPLTAVAAIGPPGPVKLTTSASVNVPAWIASVNDRVNRSMGAEVFPLGDAEKMRGPFASKVTKLSMLVEARLRLFNASCAAP